MGLREKEEGHVLRGQGQDLERDYGMARRKGQGLAEGAEPGQAQWAQAVWPAPQLAASVFGQVVTALGSPWHPEHFVCAQCGAALGGCNFFEKDGAPYCERDYFQRFAPRCARCHQPILDVSQGP